LPIDEIRYPDNLATEVTVVISERDTAAESIYFICLRATSVDVLYSTLRSYKYRNKIVGKELHLKDKAIPPNPNVRLNSLLDSSEWMLTFYLVAQEGPAKVKLEDQEEDELGDVPATLRPNEYAGAVELASQQLEISLSSDVAHKPLHVKEAVLQELLCLQTALKPLLQKCIACEDDKAEIHKVHGHIEKFEAVARSAITAPTVVGVMGATGSGKSSLMNALLGSELFPVSGTRACTAAITEISRNNNDVPFRAVIEFVSLETWRAELELLRQDTESEKEPDSEGR